MGFNTDPLASEAYLVDVIDEDEGGKPLDICEAVFSDDTRLEFPKGVRLPPDNSYDPSGRLILQRVRATSPKGKDGKPLGPDVHVPLNCSKHYVEKVIERLNKGV